MAVQCRFKSQNLHWSGFWKFLSRQYARLILNIIFFLQFNICISKILFLKPFISHICCANFDPLISYSCTKNIFWVLKYFQTLSRDHFEIFSCQLLTLYRITAYFNIMYQFDEANLGQLPRIPRGRNSCQVVIAADRIWNSLVLDMKVTSCIQGRQRFSQLSP